MLTQLGFLCFGGYGLVQVIVNIIIFRCIFLMIKIIDKIVEELDAISIVVYEEKCVCPKD